MEVNEQPKKTMLDAVSSHLYRRVEHADNEALNLALIVRDLQTQLIAARSRIAELENPNAE